MNFGGIHFFINLFFVVCCMGLTIVYLYLAYLVYAAFRKGVYRFRHRVAQNHWIAGRGPDPSSILTPPRTPYVNIAYLKKSAVLTVVILGLLYTGQHLKWLKNTNRHYAAKEYYAAGQVVFAHRRVMELILHPENILMRPYTAMQRVIYNRGTALLPENDGERYVWENAWFHYLYTRRKHRPYGVQSTEYEPAMVALLDQCWKTMEGMATRDIEDPAMQRKSLIEFPLLASYYTLLQGHYTGKLRGAGTRRRKTPFLIKRNHLILNWLDQLKDRWVSKGMMEELKSGYSAVLAYRQEIVLYLVQDAALTLAGQGKFDCTHPVILRLHKEYVDAMSDDPDRNFFLLYSKKNRKQAKITYGSSVYGGKGGAANYFLSNLCNKEMPKETYLVVKKRDIYSEFDSKKDVEHVFSQELKGLKGREK